MNIFDTINDLVAQAGAAFRGIVGVGAAILFFVISGKARWAVSTTLITGVIAAFVIFMVAGGLELFSTQIDGTVNTKK